MQRNICDNFSCLFSKIISDMDIMYNFVEGVLLILFLFCFVIHLFRICFITAKYIKTGQRSFNEYINVVNYNYFAILNDTLWSKQKALIYRYVKNKHAIWILDSFLSFAVLKSEWTQKKWKNLILRASIFYISFQCWYIPYSIYIFMFALITIGTAKDWVQDFVYPHQTSFDFQSLPLPIQQRFYELQKPVTRYRFSKAYFPLSLKSTYNKIYFDDVFIRRSPHCHMIFEKLIPQQSSSIEIIKPSLTLGCNVEAACKCPEEKLRNIAVVKAIYAKLLLPEHFLRSLSTLNFTNAKVLKIFGSFLNSNDLAVLSTMKLKFAFLHVGGHEKITILDILESLAGVLHLRIGYEGECDSPDNFAVHLVEWVLENGYIESLVIRGIFFGEKLDFKSSSEVSIDDTFDSI